MTFTVISLHLSFNMSIFHCMLRSHSRANRAIEKGVSALESLHPVHPGPGHLCYFCIGVLIGSWGTLLGLFIWVSWHWSLSCRHCPISPWSCGSARSIWLLWTMYCPTWASMTRCLAPAAFWTNGFSRWIAALTEPWRLRFPAFKDGGVHGIQHWRRTSVSTSSSVSTTYTMRWSGSPLRDLWTCVRTMQIGHHGGGLSWHYPSSGCQTWSMRQHLPTTRSTCCRTISTRWRGRSGSSRTGLAWLWKQLLLIHLLWRGLSASMLGLPESPWLRTIRMSCFDPSSSKFWTMSGIAFPSMSTWSTSRPVA